jgi:hypothetical protein
MPRVVIDPAVPESEALDNEIARLRGLDVGELRERWHTALRRRAPPHLPRHLLFRILAYRLQADRLGDLGADSRRLLDRIGSGPLDGIDRLVADLNRSRTELRAGTLLTREWDGRLQRVMVLADGFSWNACPRSPSPSRARAGTAPGFSACGIDQRRRSDREERNDQIGSLRHLHPRVDRPRA